MRSSRFILFAIALALTTGALFQGARILSRQRRQLAAWEQRTAHSHEQLTQARHEHEATTRELSLAERQLAELTDSSAVASDAGRARETEIAAWLAQVKRLKQLFEQRPEQRIPEMRLLTDEDWLRVGKHSGVDDEEHIRKALADVRSAAKRRFVRSLAAATQKFSAANNGVPPANSVALAPYLANPADAEFLPHVEIAEWSGATHGGSRWTVREKSPMDVDYDSRYSIGPNGGSYDNGPSAWIPDFQERSRRANQDYSTANKGARSTGIGSLIPYFSPPLDPATAEKLLKAERDGGR